ncbi:hypothetical protein MMC31_003342 [Peltigera leucophlebia]|nr:hypothetical protein [Peltigera leucophlebia]
MGITTRSGKATERNDPTLRANDWDLWAFQNHPERWQETFYTNFVDSDEEEGGITGDEESTIADEGGDSESTAAAMGIDAGMKDGNPNVERDDMVEGSWNYRERDGSALFKGNEMDERDEDPMEDDEALGALAGDNYDQNSDSSEMKFKKFFAPSAKDIEKQGESLRSESADSEGGVGETEDEGTNSLQPDSEDDKAQTEDLDPSIDKENLQMKYTCTCTHCGGKGHNRAEKKAIVEKLVGLKNLVLRSAKVNTAALTVGERAMVVKHAKIYTSRQSTSAPGAEKQGILRNTVHHRKTLPRVNPSAATVVNTATIVIYVRISIFRQNTSVPIAED